ncbi:MAG: hypothetical protein AB1465_03860 [Patescibacteria group bacterium]
MANIQQNFVIVSESAIIDKFTNNLYLLGIFSNINTTNVPAIHPSFTITTNFSGEDGEHDHKILIKHEDGTEIGKLEGKIKFVGGQNTQYIGRFIGFPFPKYGIYNISIFIDNKEQPLRAKINVIKP